MDAPANAPTIKKKGMNSVNCLFRINRIARKGFLSGGRFAPAVAGERPTVEAARLEVEENRVFSWRVGWGGGSLVSLERG